MSIGGEDKAASVRELPILFQDRLVRAILRLVNPKTQTRRLLRIPEWVGSGGQTPHACDLSPTGFSWGTPAAHDIGNCRSGNIAIRCPYGRPGDRLWVREAAMHVPVEDVIRLRRLAMEPGPWNAQAGGVLYRATAMEPFVETLVKEGRRWRPSIHLPRAAARILLEVQEVRIERLHAITEDDAQAEGVERAHPAAAREAPCGSGPCGGWLHPSGVHTDTAKETFRDLWDRINGKRPDASWAANPWVWVVTFRRVTP